MICDRYPLCEILTKNVLRHAFGKARHMSSTSAIFIIFMTLMRFPMKVSCYYSSACFLNISPRCFPQRRIQPTGLSSPFVGCSIPKSTACLSSKNFDDLLNDVILNKLSDSSSPSNSSKNQNHDCLSKSESDGWRIIDWNAEADFTLPPTAPSPVDTVMIRDRLVYIKRDDQVRVSIRIL